MDVVSLITRRISDKAVISSILEFYPVNVIAFRSHAIFFCQVHEKKPFFPIITFSWSDMHTLDCCITVSIAIVMILKSTLEYGR